MTKKSADWTFFSNHGHVYFLVVLENEITTREVAGQVGITERAVASILSDLVESGYVKKTKVGRSNVYTAAPHKTLRHPLEEKIQLKSLVDIFKKSR
jgi:predicted transcriptional regulator